MMAFSPEPGAVQLIGNRFGASEYADAPPCVLDVPYDYEDVLDATVDLPGLFAGGIATAVEEMPQTPRSFYLNNSPDPFNAITHIRFLLFEAQRVALEVFNLQGQKIVTLIDNQHLPQGVHRIQWDATGRTSGVYLYRLLTKESSHIGKMALTK